MLVNQQGLGLMQQSHKNGLMSAKSISRPTLIRHNNDAQWQSSCILQVQFATYVESGR